MAIALTILWIILTIALGVYWFLLTAADRALLKAPVKEITVDGGTRTYRLFNTESKNNNARPLVVGFHGLNDRALWLGLYSGLHQLSIEEDFVLALPSGIDQAWNGTFCCGSAFRNQPDDTEFIRQMVADIANQTSIDEQQIYAVGFSNGGVMAQKILAELPDIFTSGAGVMSGIRDEDGGKLDISNASPERLLLINGTMDQYIPVGEPRDNPERYQFIPARQSAEVWAKHLGLDLTTTTERGDITTYIYGDGQLIQRIYEAKHRWPQWRLWTLPNEVPESTRLMWKFLDAGQY